MLTIGPLDDDAIVEIASAFAAIGWKKPAQQLHDYLAEQRSGARSVLVARWSGSLAGYGTLLQQSAYPPFRQAGTPEIADLNVLSSMQRRGIGSQLLSGLEALAARSSPIVGIGVGLTEDYGAAQRLYVARGYVPDGRGAYAQAAPLRWGETVAVDDTLVVHLTKSLRA